MLPIEESIHILKGDNIKYSRAGGAAGSILLIETENSNSIWIWCYWEIYHSGRLLATADDDATANVGKIAVAAKKLEGKRIEQIELSLIKYDLIVYFADDYRWIVNCESQPDGEKYPLNNWELIIKKLNTQYFVTCNFIVIQKLLKREFGDGSE